MTEHTESTLSNGNHLSSVCGRQLPQPWQVLGLSILLKLAAACRVAANGTAEFIFNEAQRLLNLM